MQHNRFANLYMEVIPPKRFINVELPDPFIVESYYSQSQSFTPSNVCIHFQIDILYDRKRRRYYGRHDAVKNCTVIYDVFHNKHHEFNNDVYQNLLDFHKDSLIRYHKMLVEFYVFRL